MRINFSMFISFLLFSHLKIFHLQVQKSSGFVESPDIGNDRVILVSICSSSDQHLSRKDRHSPHRGERSPRKKADRRGHMSKLDIMSDEFAEKLKKRPMRRRRDRSVAVRRRQSIVRDKISMNARISTSLDFSRRFNCSVLRSRANDELFQITIP